MGKPHPLTDTDTDLILRAPKLAEYDKSTHAGWVYKNLSGDFGLSMKKIPRSRLLVRRLITVQLILVVVLPVIALYSGPVAAYSVLIGALTCFVPNLYFVYRAFKFSGARSAKKILRSFYAGESIKILLTAVLFGLVFALVKPLSILAVFAGYIAIQATSWLTPLLTIRRTG